jgi:glycosyltransferase involved in cell wall biosynthesis
MKNLLLIAYHFPPYAGGSGVHRAAKFFQYLPENGWSPYVLTTGTLAYENIRLGKDNNGTDPAAPSRIIRTFALDAQRHLSIKGRYPGWLAIPDRWANWVLTAVPAGVAAIYRRKIGVIVVTFPIATSVLIGLILHRLTTIPLVVDFRDSMTEDDYPRDAFIRSIHRRIETSVMKRGARFVFTAESARRMYLDRYPQVHPDKCIVISNGYDEEDFAGIPFSHKDLEINRPTRLVHAGLIYPDERDPRPFFRALSRLRAEGNIQPENLRVELRASGSEDYYSTLIRELKIEDVVFLLPALPYRSALENIATADGLLLLQAANCNHQIPAKTYEYLRLGIPILALTSAEGDTAALLNDSGGATVVDLANEDSIYQVFPKFMKSVQNGSHPLPDRQKVPNYSRRSQAAVLANCLNQAVSSVVTEAEPLHVSVRSE